MKKGIVIASVVFAVIAAGMLFIFGLDSDVPEIPVAQVADDEGVKKIETLYDIPVDSFTVVTGVIGRNEMLGNILNDHGVSARRVYEVSLLPRDQFDVRRIKAGNRYALFLDSLGVRYVVYEQDNINYTVVHMDDSIHVEAHKKAVTVSTGALSGVINSSLWETIKEQGVSPVLALELSEIYAWSIDFFGLQQGDSFRVIYDESFVDNVSVGITKIHSAWFFHAGHAFWAIPFEQDSVVTFFDEEGNSLRKAFLKAPLRYSRISSGFSHSRMHPILKIRRPHHGVDYAAPTGTPVEAVGDGQVIAATYQRGGGNYIKIKHNGIYTTAYLHLSRFARGIRVGVYVKQGDVIGYVGSTGLSTGPHLDFRFYKNGQPINPLKVEAPPVEPVHEENLADFDLVKRSVMAELNAIE